MPYEGNTANATMEGTLSLKLLEKKPCCSNQFYILNVANTVLEPQLGDTGSELFRESIEAGQDSEREKHKRDRLGSWRSKSKDMKVVSTGGVPES